MKSPLERISTPTIKQPCGACADNGDTISARYLLGGQALCEDHADLTLIVASIGATPAQLSLLDAAREELHATHTAVIQWKQDGSLVEVSK